jgi:uncharacterized protein YggE
MSKFIQYISFVIVLSFPISSIAGTIQITGQGEASLPPDMFKIEVAVNSVCYESTKQAKAANAEIANKVIPLAQKYLRDSRDELTTHPGGFTRETEYIPTGDGHSRILCERKWRTWNTISLTLHDISSLSELQDELVSFLAPIEGLKPDKQEQTFAQLSSPEFLLTSENQIKLRKDSQQAALDDAKDQFRNFDANCHFNLAKLSSVSTPNFNTVVRYGAKMADVEDSSTPVIPENITVTAVWNFIWEFESAPGCYN